MTDRQTDSNDIGCGRGYEMGGGVGEAKYGGMVRV